MADLRSFSSVPMPPTAATQARFDSWYTTPRLTTKTNSDMSESGDDMMAGFDWAETIAVMWQKSQVVPPRPLKLKYFDVAEDKADVNIIPHAEEEASEHESLSGDDDDADQKSDDEQDESEEDDDDGLIENPDELSGLSSDEDEEKDMAGEDKYIWANRLDRVIHHFSHDFTVGRCIMNKLDRKVYTVIRKTDQQPLVLIISRDMTSRLLVKGVPREVRIMSRLRKCENVGQIQAWTALGRHHYAILTEYYPNSDIPLSMHGNHHLIARFMQGLLQGLNHMHQRNIVHRDIATGNVLWNPVDEKVTIIDFDLSAPRRPRYYRNVGRDNYDSPEKIETLAFRQEMRSSGRRRPEGKEKLFFYDEKSDVYAAGVIFWVLLNEKDHSTSPEQLRKWVKKVIKKKYDRKHIELDLLVKMLDHNRERRISAADALKHPFLVNPPPADETYTVMRTYLSKMNAAFEKMKRGEPLSDDEEPVDDDDDKEDEEEDEEDEKESQEEKVRAECQRYQDKLDVENSDENEDDDDDDEKSDDEQKVPEATPAPQ